MDPNESRLPAPPDGRSPADLTKKDLVAHLTSVLDVPARKLNALTRQAIIALFDLSLDEALAAVNSNPGNRQKRRRHTSKTAENSAVYEHFLTGRIRRN